jgi:transcriptional antiterminator RfaH
MRGPLMSTENWYCLKARPRQERTAKCAIQQEIGLEVFCPMLRFERARKSGRVRVVEAMFPGYLFARFCYEELYRLVRTTKGVSTIVSFGGLPIVVPDAIIAELRSVVSEGETVEIPTTFSVGEEVQLVEGPFQGLRAVVTKILPARARVTVLLELLGMEREVEVGEQAVMPDIPHPLAPR